jgi:hypothetical protein
MEVDRGGSLYTVPVNPGVFPVLPALWTIISYESRPLVDTLQ